jgi:hypothetical protein
MLGSLLFSALLSVTMMGKASLPFETPERLSSEDLEIQNRIINDMPNLIAQDYPAILSDGFVFELRGCESTANSDRPLRCDFLVENADEQRRGLYLYAYWSSSNKSRIIDAEGNEVVGSFVEFGNSSDSSYALAELSSGIPVRASIWFPNAPQGGIRLVDVRYEIYRGGTGNVEFRFTN